MDYVGVPLRPDDFALDLPAVLEALEREQPVLTFIAYPNNPTGNLFDRPSHRADHRGRPGPGRSWTRPMPPSRTASFLPRLGDWPNLLVMRTVSKMGLAGLRLGYLAGPAGVARARSTRSACPTTSMS